jgi:hypothetical protein
MRYTEISERIGGMKSALKSKEIINYLNRPEIDKPRLLKLVMESKTGFDQAVLDTETKEFFNGIEEAEIYTADYPNLLLSVCSMSESGNSDIRNNMFISSLMLFHKIFNGVLSFISMLNDQALPGKDEEPKDGKVHQIPSEQVSLEKFLKSFAAVAV